MSYKGTHLREARKKQGVSQQVLAVRFDVSQKQISLMENGDSELSQKAIEYIEEHGADDDGAEDAGETSPRYSYTRPTFNRLWAESEKRVEHMLLRGTIEPSRWEGFVDTTLEIDFQGLRVPRGEDALYMDCVGVVPQTRPPSDDSMIWTFDASEGTDLKFVNETIADDASASAKQKDQRRPHKIAFSRAQRAHVEAVPEVRNQVGPHAAAYTISRADEDDVVQVVLRADRGCRTDRVEAVGLPVYPDCVVKRLSISLTFIDIEPTTHPSAQVWLVRRTVGDGRPLDLASGLDITVKENSTKYSFDNLLYPKAGFGYAIAWGGLRNPGDS